MRKFFENSGSICPRSDARLVMRGRSRRVLISGRSEGPPTSPGAGGPGAQRGGHGQRRRPAERARAAWRASTPTWSANVAAPVQMVERHHPVLSFSQSPLHDIDTGRQQLGRPALRCIGHSQSARSLYRDVFEKNNILVKNLRSFMTKRTEALRCVVCAGGWGSPVQVQGEGQQGPHPQHCSST